MAYIDWVILYLITDGITTYSKLRILNSQDYKFLKSQGWRNAVIGDKPRCKDFLKYAKGLKNVRFEDNPTITNTFVRKKDLDKMLSVS
jgi:hypothetical protein